MTHAPKTQELQLSDIPTLRQRGRQHAEKGAVTPSYAADRGTVLRLLNEALATELVCVLRYRRHYYMVDGLRGEAIKDEFMAHSLEEQGRADELAQRIVQRLLALTLGMFINRLLGRPPRALAAYDGR